MLVSEWIFEWFRRWAVFICSFICLFWFFWFGFGLVYYQSGYFWFCIFASNWIEKKKRWWNWIRSIEPVDQYMHRCIWIVCAWTWARDCLCHWQCDCDILWNKQKHIKGGQIKFKLHKLMMSLNTTIKKRYFMLVVRTEEDAYTQNGDCARKTFPFVLFISSSSSFSKSLFCSRCVCVSFMNSDKILTQIYFILRFHLENARYLQPIPSVIKKSKLFYCFFSAC